MIPTVSSLQHEFGLPFATAEAIIREQTGVVRKRYRLCYLLNGIALVSAVACKFAPHDSPYYPLDDLLLPLACLFLGVGEVLTQREARPLIRAAAQAIAPPG